MKFIITESQLSNHIEKSLNKMIKKDSYSWIEKIEIEINKVNWISSNNPEAITYKIYFKDETPPDFIIQDRFFSRIASFHDALFPSNNYEERKMYFNTMSVLPDGSESSFPYFET